MQVEARGERLMANKSKRHIVIKDARIPPRKFIVTDDALGEPTFSVSEVGKFFFARSSHWVRLLEREGFFSENGENVGGRRTNQGVRIYTLSDVEQMVRMLAKKKRIDGRQLQRTLQLVHAEANLWGYFDEEG
jgi:hypothetical protein